MGVPTTAFSREQNVEGVVEHGIFLSQDKSSTYFLIPTFVSFAFKLEVLDETFGEHNWYLVGMKTCLVSLDYVHLCHASMPES